MSRAGESLSKNIQTIYINDLFQNVFIIHCYIHTFLLGVAMKRFLTLIVTVFLFVIAIVLGLKNQQLMNVDYLVAQSEIRLSTLLAITFLLGFVVAVIFGVFFYLKLKVINRKLCKINKKQYKELEQLRIANTFEKE
ncbi:lipopolysaccharide assembly protein LapA domain-containing protein [Psychromonas antarctica]|nr:lipopolysaccharide assembly protein LapA domain-containing protein [Psychromonas antarctica]